MGRGLINFLGGLGTGALSEYHRQQLNERQDKRDKMLEQSFEVRMEGDRLALADKRREAEDASALRAHMALYDPSGASAQPTPTDSAQTAALPEPPQAPDPSTVPQQVIAGPNQDPATYGRTAGQLTPEQVQASNSQRADLLSAPAAASPSPSAAAPAGAAAQRAAPAAVGGLAPGAVDGVHGRLLWKAKYYQERNPELAATAMEQAHKYQAAHTKAQSTAIINSAAEVFARGGGYQDVANMYANYKDGVDARAVEDGKGGATISFYRGGKPTGQPWKVASPEALLLGIERALNPQRVLDEQIARESAAISAQAKLAEERRKLHPVSRGGMLVRGDGATLAANPYNADVEEVEGDDGTITRRTVGGGSRASKPSLHPIVDKAFGDMDSSLKPVAQVQGDNLLRNNPGLPENEAYAMGVRIARGDPSNIKPQFDVSTGMFVRRYTDTDVLDAKGRLYMPGSGRSFTLSRDEYGSGAVTEAQARAAVEKMRVNLKPETFAQYAATATPAGEAKFGAQAKASYDSLVKQATQQLAKAETPQAQAAVKLAFETAVNAIKAEARKAQLVSQFHKPPEPAPAKGAKP